MTQPIMLPFLGWLVSCLLVLQWPATNIFYVFGSGAGWWLAIALIAGIREKIAYSNVVPGIRGMGITFIMTGLIALVFMGLQGIALDQPTGDIVEEALVEPVLPSGLRP